MRLPAILLALSLASDLAAKPDRDPARWVDPFIGTGGHGHTFPGPSLPFGMVQPGPDTRLTGWDGCSGYHASDRVIYGFSQTHLSGTGCSDYGDILLLPATGPVKWRNGYRSQGGETPLPRDTAGYGSAFDKASERAEAGFYAVTLSDYRVRAEATATLRTGLYRFTFARAEGAHILVDLTHRDTVLESALRIVDGRTVEGFRRSRAWASDQPVHFRASFSRPFRAELAVDDTVVAARTASGKSIKAALRFDLEPGDTVEVQIALSAVDATGATKNLTAERSSFDAARRAARTAWNRQLGKVTVAGGSENQRTVFSTALYHAFLQPNVFQDADGRFLGRDGKIHRAKGYTRHTVFSLWDTFRAAHPLYALVERRRTTDFIRTFLDQYREVGRLPVWELWGNETDCMIGYHAVPVIVDAWMKGIRGFDAELALKAMVASADADRPDLAAYRRYGFIPADAASESVSKTLEYAFDDACIARFAEALGRKDLAARFRARAQGWRHLLDPGTGLFRPREAARFLEPFDPAEVTFHFTEANGWQYGFFVPHDLQGLMDATGGDAAFTGRLDALFAADSRTKGRDQADITGLVGQYAHGNEPSHHMAYLYAFAGAAPKTQALVRRLREEMYRPGPDGLIGNEDCGQMSAWFILSALGFYPVDPGGGDFVVGAPLFPRAEVAFENGRKLVIRAEGEGPFVQDLRLNGRPHPRAVLTHTELLAGGTLVFRMGPETSAWGTGVSARPRIVLPGPAVLPAPRVVGPTVSVGAVTWPVEGQGRILLGLDGQPPISPAPAELRLERSARVTLVAVDGERRSAAVEASFLRLDPRRRITLKTKPHAQYTGGGESALIDGQRGGDDFRLGAWQGFHGMHLDAEVDLGEVRDLRRVALGCLQDQNSWIFMPTAVRIEASEDGRAWRLLGIVENTVDPRQDGVVRRDFAVSATGRARHLRVHAEAPLLCPDWHKGHPNPSFIFADEILVE